MLLRLEYKIVIQTKENNCSLSLDRKNASQKFFNQK